MVKGSERRPATQAVEPNSVKQGSPRSFVIGDVHGCSATLRRLVDGVLRPTRNDRICMLGDLIDRGPDSKGVLDFIFELRERGLSVAGVRGNHEEMCLRSVIDPYCRGMWIANGGKATLDSFNVDTAGDIPERYLSFMKSLPHYILLDDFVIVHAGLNFAQLNPFEDTSAMLWSRSSHVDRASIGGRRLICGHTPVPRIDLEISLNNNKIMLDNGCVYHEHPELGGLAALELERKVVHYQENIDH